MDEKQGRQAPKTAASMHPHPQPFDSRHQQAGGLRDVSAYVSTRLRCFPAHMKHTQGSADAHGDFHVHTRVKWMLSAGPVRGIMISARPLLLRAAPGSASWLGAAVHESGCVAAHTCTTQAMPCRYLL